MEKELKKVANLMESGDYEETELTAIAIRIIGIAARNYNGKLRTLAMKIAFAICDFDEELEQKEK